MLAHVDTIILLGASGAFQAAFALPVRALRRWRWEQMWVAQSVTANVLFPLGWAALAPRGFWLQASQIPFSHWCTGYAWGLLWGLGGLAWGLTMASLGLAFSNSFVFGVSVITGALLPIVTGAADPPHYPLVFAAGLVLCVCMTVCLGILRRSGDQRPLLPVPFGLRSYGAIVVIALFAGFAAAGYGLAFSFSFPVLHTLMANGVSAAWASLAVVLPVYTGGASVAIPAGLAVAAKSRSIPLLWRNDAVWNWFLALVMGGCAAGTAVLYGVAGSGSGHPSPNIAFCVWVSFLVLGGIAFGFLGGEMRGCSRRTGAGFVLSACALLAGACLLNLR